MSLAYSYGLGQIKENDEILVMISSHHSNLVPWQMVSKKTGCQLNYLLVDEQGDLPEEELLKITEKTKLVTFPWISNGIGTKVDALKIINAAHEKNAVVVVDAAQVVGHEAVDVELLGADFLVFSGHKMFGPQGIGVMYAKYKWLKIMDPFLLGGDMIEYVTLYDTTYAQIPEKFEAGTQNVTGAKGLIAAIDFIEDVGMDRIMDHERELTDYAYDQLKRLEFVTVYGVQEAYRRGSVIVFNVDGVHPHDVASILDEGGVAIRAGHHCSQPLMKHLGLQATCRISYSIYNGFEDIDVLVHQLKRVREVFGYVD